MNTNYTKHIIAATVMAIFALVGLLSLFGVSGILTASFAVIAALGYLAGFESRSTGYSSYRRRAKARSHA